MDASTVAQMLGSLVAIIAVIFAFAWLARRMPMKLGGARGDLRVHATLAVGARERVMIVQAGAAYLVLGVSPGQIRTLHVLDQAPSDFAAVMQAQERA